MEVLSRFGQREGSDLKKKKNVYVCVIINTLIVFILVENKE